MIEKDLFQHVNVGLGLFQNDRLAALRENSTAWIGLQLRRTAQNNFPTSSARSDAFRRANGMGVAARRNARVWPRGHLIASMERQPCIFT